MPEAVTTDGTRWGARLTAASRASSCMLDVVVMLDGIKLHAGATVVLQFNDLRLFYGCSYGFHLSGDNSRDRHVKGAWEGSVVLRLFLYVSPVRQ